MRKILITGCGGFVGSAAVRYFLKKDWQVVGIDSWAHKGDPWRLQNVRTNRNLTIVSLDMAHPFEVETDFDVILNIASDSHVERSITDPVPFVKNNVNLMLHILEVARKQKKLTHFIQCSTDEVFGPAEDGQFHKEWELTLPSNPYSASKAAQEAIAYSYWRTFDVPYMCTNTMNMFGPMQDDEKFIPLAIKKIKNGETIDIHGEPGDIGSRMYLDVYNLVDAWGFLIEYTKPILYSEGAKRPLKYNVVGEVEMNNLDLVTLIAELMNKDLSFRYQNFHATRPGHDRRYALDGAKIRDLGWRHPKDFEESLQRTITWFLSNDSSMAAVLASREREQEAYAEHLHGLGDASPSLGYGTQSSRTGVQLEELSPSVHQTPSLQHQKPFLSSERPCLDSL